MIEFGAGKVLTGLARAACPGPRSCNVQEPADVDGAGGAGSPEAPPDHVRPFRPQGAGHRRLGRHRRRHRPRAARAGLPRRPGRPPARGAGRAGGRAGRGAATWSTGDVADAAAADALVAAADPVDILVNNAGITRDMLALRLKDADWQAVLDTNLTARLPARAGRPARACSSGAAAASSTSPRSSASPAIRARPTTPRPRPGLIGMSKALAQEVAARGVTVNCVAPGFIDTAMTQALDERQREALLGRIPAARLGVGRRRRRRRGLPRQRRGRLRHRPDPARQWRDGHDLRSAGAVRPPACPPSQAWGLRVQAPTPRASSLCNPRRRPGL